MAVAQPKILLVSSSGESHVAQGLNAMGVVHERISPAELRKRSPFASDVVFFDRDVSRTDLARDAETWRTFVRLGGVFVGFRTSEQEAWLPVPATHDRGYETGELLTPEHRIFTTPHRLDLEALRAVHMGSIYHALCALGEGWTPLVQAGKPLGWDKRAAKDDGPHYGMAELVHGKGRILLVELIPAYNWFHDEKGKSNAPGARLFENIVSYALANATEQAAARPPAKPLANAVRSLSDLVPAPAREPGLDMEQGWTVTGRGPYTSKTDFRGIRTFLHEDRPSQAGNFIQATARIALPAKRTGEVLLQWYESDTYCGGRERILGGAKHGQTALDNRKAGYRFKQILVNGQVAWEEDVLGRNVQPARNRFRTVDIAPFLERGKGEAEVTLRVEDRKDSGDLPFFIEVFFARVAVLPERAAGEPLFGEEGAAAATQILGRELVPLPDGSVRVSDSCRGSWLVGVPQGTYRLAIQAVDSPDGYGRIGLRGKDGSLGEWELTANDGRAWWLLSRPVPLGVERLTVDFRIDGPPIEVARVAILPFRPSPAEAAKQREAVQPVTVPLSLAETAGVARRNEVSAQTVPLPEGLLRDPGQVCLRDAAGTPVSVQTRAVAHWPDGSVKILHASFPASLAAQGAASFALAAPDRPEGTPPVELRVREREDAVEIDSGPIRTVLSTTHGRIVDAIYRGQARETPENGAWDLVLETEDGTILRSAAATVTETEVVERGPLRALVVRKGWFAAEDGTPSRLEYRIQTEMSAGSDQIRVQTFLVNRDDADGIYLKRWSMDLAWSRAQEGTVLLGDREFRAQAGAVLYQHRENEYSWSGIESASRVPGQCSGLVRLPGLAFGTRWFWQRFPQAIRFADARICQDFIPRPLDDGDLPTEWAERMAQTTDKYPVGGVGYPQSPGKMGLFRLARGQALRQETLFRLTSSGDPLPELLADLDHPLRAFADPAYVSATRAYGQLHPHDERIFPEYEKSVGAFLAGYLAKREKRREYGFENYGDDTFEWGYGPSYTYWSNSEYDHHHGFALQYLRSGDPQWWGEFLKTARQYADVVVIHHEIPGGHPQLGGPRHHNATSMWMPSHERQCWVADHTRQAADSGHSWAEGIVDYWFLTGDPWAEEVAREMADWYVRIVALNRYGAGGQERGPGWALIALSALARATNDEQVLAAGQSVADWIANWQDPVRGVVSVPISEQPSYEGGTVFMHGIVGRGLGRWHDVTGDPRAKEALLKLADWLLTEPMGAPGRFWYKQAPDCMKGYGATSQTLNALAYAYTLSGEERYARVAEILLGSCGAGVRSMSWFPQVLAQLAPLRHPVVLKASAGRAVAAPESPAVLSVDVQNTSGLPLRVVPRITLPAGFAGDAPASFVLEPGAAERISVEVRATEPGNSGTARIDFELIQEGGAPVRRSASFALRSVAAVERRLLQVGEARIQPPMRRIESAGQPFIDDPRPADFGGDPLPADQTRGGSATWTLNLLREGEFVLWAEVKWLDQKGNSFHLSVDGASETVLGNVGDVGPWTWVRGPTLSLSAGEHRIRVRTREEGAQLGGLWLTNLPEDTPPPARK